MRKKTNLTFQDKTLPSQPLFREYFEGDEESFLTALYNTIVKFSGLISPMEKFEIYKSEEVDFELMASSPIMLQFLQYLVLITSAKRILEIGTFVGVSAMSMASVLSEDGRVITIEKYGHFADIARRNVIRNKLSDKVEVIHGDAFQELKKLANTQLFDFIFLDGNKERYYEYFTLLDPLLKGNGVLVVDDVFFHGDVLNGKPKSKKGAGVLKFLENVRTLDSYFKVILPVSNGMMLMLKRS
ncbi:MAG: O-methyltransferase [Nitrososphaerales archaeon]